jgi:hypothetical protein
MTKQKTIEVNAKVKMFKLDPSFFMYAIILSSKLKEFNNDFTSFAMATLVMLLPQKTLIVT